MSVPCQPTSALQRPTVKAWGVIGPGPWIDRSNTDAQLKQTVLERDQEISSLQHKLQLAEADLEKAEDKVKELKGQADEGDAHKTTGENLSRKVQLLEEELDKAEKDLKDTTEKLRQVDVKAEHFERQLQRAEQERDEWEKKAAVSREVWGCVAWLGNLWLWLW